MGSISTNDGGYLKITQVEGNDSTYKVSIFAEYGYYISSYSITTTHSQSQPSTYSGGGPTVTYAEAIVQEYDFTYGDVQYSGAYSGQVTFAPYPSTRKFIVHVLPQGGGTVDGKSDKSEVELSIGQTHTFQMKSNTSDFWGFCILTDSAFSPLSYNAGLSPTNTNGLSGSYTAEYNNFYDALQNPVVELYAYFRPAVKIVASVKNENGGTVYVYPQDFDGLLPGDGTWTYNAGQNIESVLIKSTPDEGRQISGWEWKSPDGKGRVKYENTLYKGLVIYASGGLDGSKPLPISSSKRPVFYWYCNMNSGIYDIETNIYPKSPSPGGTTTGGGHAYSELNHSITAYPNSGFRFDHWEDGDGNNVSTLASYQFSPTKNEKFTAFFVPQYDITIATEPSTGGNVSPTGGMVDAGSQITLSASSSSNYTFLRWASPEDDRVNNSTQNPITITINQDATYIAVFDPDPDESQEYTLNSASANPSQGTTSPSTKEYRIGGAVEFSASASNGYRFSYWTKGLSGGVVSTSPTIKIYPEDKDDGTTYYAHFEDAGNGKLMVSPITNQLLYDNRIANIGH